ncbi:hypothetical protein [Sulfitobacter sp. SH24]|uniref:hypothetical protein n=1 Tax=Sulfitobacter sp. SH24 TaxID=3421173 RepID=UPI003F50D10A
MSKVVMKFFKGHGVYVAGDIAGFEPEKAAKLKSVARPYDEKAEAEQAKQMERIGTVEARDMIAQAGADFAAKEADLQEREAALAAREAALNANGGVDETTPAKGKASGKGEPPAQGGTDAAKK